MAPTSRSKFPFARTEGLTPTQFWRGLIVRGEGIVASPIPIATDDDIREFRRIRSEQGGVRLDREKNPVRRTLTRLNRILGRPWRLRWRAANAVRASFRGVRRNGAAIAAEHGIGTGTQFLQILAASAQTGMNDEDYYLLEIYRPERWRSRHRHFPTNTHSLSAIDWLIQKSRPPDFRHLRNKHLFAARCAELGLPSIGLVASFVDGERGGGGPLPKTDLFSKPANQHCGIGAAAWEYHERDDRFVNPVTGSSVSESDLVKHLLDLSHRYPMVLQRRMRNHAALQTLAGTALSTIRLVTCRSPSGSIDFMPPVMRMPAGEGVVDNFAQGGLLAPLDFATGTISGRAAQRDNALVVRWLERHSDSGQKLVGFKIPFWAEALSLANRAHVNFPSLSFVGWDVAILKDGPVLVEANPLFDTDVSVMPHGLTLSDTQFIPYYNHHWHEAIRAESH